MQIKMESSEKEFNELLEKKQEKVQQNINKNILNYKISYLILELIISIIGYGLVWYHVGFAVTIGIWFILWANNMSRNRTAFRRNKNIDQEIWK